MKGGMGGRRKPHQILKGSLILNGVALKKRSSQTKWRTKRRGKNRVRYQFKDLSGIFAVRKGVGGGHSGKDVRLGPIGGGGEGRKKMFRTQEAIWISRRPSRI